MRNILTNKELIEAYKVICDELKQANNEERIEVLSDMEELTRSLLHSKIYLTLQEHSNELGSNVKPGHKVLEEI